MEWKTAIDAILRNYGVEISQLSGSRLDDHGLSRTRHLIWHDLANAGLSQVEIARAFDVTKAAVSIAIKRPVNTLGHCPRCGYRLTSNGTVGMAPDPRPARPITPQTSATPATEIALPTARGYTVAAKSPLRSVDRIRILISVITDELTDDETPIYSDWGAPYSQDRIGLLRKWLKDRVSVALYNGWKHQIERLSSDLKAIDTFLSETGYRDDGASI